MSTINFNAKLNKADYIKGFLILMFWTWKIWPLVLFLGVMFSIILLPFTNHNILIAWAAALAIRLFIGCYYFFIFYKALKRRPELFHTITWDITNDSITMTDGNKIENYTKQEFLKITELKGYFFLFTKNNGYLLIAQKSIPSGDIPEFRENIKMIKK